MEPEQAEPEQAEPSMEDMVRAGLESVKSLGK